jgi:hypothetical protein
MILICHQHVSLYNNNNNYFIFIVEANELFCSSSSYPSSAANFSIPAHASGKKHKQNNEKNCLFFLTDYYSSYPYSTDWRYSTFPNFNK